MKKPFILLALALVAHAGLAQNFSFGYDASGNRTDRTIVLAKSTASQAAHDSTNFQLKEEIINDIKIIIYPNPTRDDVFVSIQNHDADTHFSLSVYDNTGRLVRTLNDPDEQSGIGLSGFPPGNYFLIIQINGKTSRWRIIKEE